MLRCAVTAAAATRVQPPQEFVSLLSPSSSFGFAPTRFGGAPAPVVNLSISGWMSGGSFAFDGQTAQPWSLFGSTSNALVVDKVALHVEGSHGSAATKADDTFQGSLGGTVDFMGVARASLNVSLPLGSKEHLQCDLTSALALGKGLSLRQGAQIICKA